MDLREEVAGDVTNMDNDYHTHSEDSSNLQASDRNPLVVRRGMGGLVVDAPSRYAVTVRFLMMVGMVISSRESSPPNIGLQGRRSFEYTGNVMNS